MSDEDLKAFREALVAAGRPYSLWGGRTVGVGLGFLVIVQILGTVQPTLLMRYGVLLMLACLVAIAIGWGLLVFAYFRRRQWAKAHPLREPPLPDAP
jgi:hypothetical protein